jgi:hypothetical protein
MKIDGVSYHQKRKFQADVLRAEKSHPGLIFSLLQGTPEEQEKAREVLKGSVTPFQVAHPARELYKKIWPKRTESKVSREGQRLVDEVALFSREKDLTRMKALSFLAKEGVPLTGALFHALHKGEVWQVKSDGTSTIKIAFVFEGVLWRFEGSFSRSNDPLLQTKPVAKSFHLERSFQGMFSRR